MDRASLSLRGPWTRYFQSHYIHSKYVHVYKAYIRLRIMALIPSSHRSLLSSPLLVFSLLPSYPAELERRHPLHSVHRWRCDLSVSQVSFHR
jgi:hypothetical protein